MLRRSPTTISVIQSTITMLAYGQRMNRKTILMHELVQYWSDRVHHLLSRCVETRQQLPAHQSIDVPFHDFMADDMGTVAEIYRLAGLELNAGAREEMASFIASHPRGKHGSVVYDLEGDFGVSPDQLRARFQFYFDAFPVRQEV